MQIKAFFAILLLYGLLISNASAQDEVLYDEKARPYVLNAEGKRAYLMPIPEGEAVGPDHAVLDVEVTPLPGATVITSEDLRRVADRKAQLAQQAAEIARQRADEARDHTLSLQEQLDSAMTKENNTEQILQLEERLKNAREIESIALREARMAQQEAANARQIRDNHTYVEAYQQEQDRKRLELQQFEGIDVISSDSYENVLLDDDYRPFGHTNEVVQFPEYNCAFEFEGVNSSGKYQVSQKEELLFTHTPTERLRPVLNGKEYLTCRAAFNQLGGYRFVSIEFTFAMDNAQSLYGTIQKGSFLVMMTLNNQYVKLLAGNGSNGVLNEKTGELTYRVIYPIDQSQINLLKRFELDKIILGWSSGYEEYETYHPGLFMHQIQCLESR
ncbi:hypothetical protein [Phaeodactylibacter sp.]|uniref:hypothetical protein n=1 Tax=Phaeodactylibacter sp. TaxID=1940289 RepID=UPI0025EDA6D3|nr:hypothetical protein [Phaeodactylibacter sp.]MCI4650618.1 hypothetical protein [Phaeodactylibacter sp.]MCI5091383.1 hypothetical protein [Phaeodactylibacter sp.]